ncbi:MAG TPA: hypothetical protein VGS12_13455 [Caulobacteraceae bacterium]|nr:hypothetical protein [Caulobacteraceae bacterium]
MTVAAGRADLDATLRAPTLAPGEPVFLLRGQDLIAPDVVRYWASLAYANGVHPAVIEQALSQADALERWAPRKLAGADHLSQDEQRQLAFRLSRRAWRATVLGASEDPLLAYRRGWDEAMGQIRAQAHG